MGEYMNQKLIERVSNVTTKVLETMKQQVGGREHLNPLGILFGKDPELTKRSDPYFFFVIYKEIEDAQVRDFDSRVYGVLNSKRVNVEGNVGHYQIRDPEIKARIAEGYVCIPSLEEMAKNAG